MKRDFEVISMKVSHTIDSFFTQFNGLVTQMRSHGETIEEIRTMEKVLMSLPSRFDVIVTTIEETKDLSLFIVDELHASLMTHEQILGRTKNHLWSMPSRPKCPLEEEEVKADQTTEQKVEEEARTEEETTLQVQVEGAATKIRIKAKATANKVEKIKHMDKGMINPKSNVITVGSMGIMPMNVGRTRVTWVIDPVLILLNKL